jgi:hypothetical protein
VLVLVNAARAAGNPSAAEPAFEFVRSQGQSDVRMSAAGAVAVASR